MMAIVLPSLKSGFERGLAGSEEGRQEHDQPTAR